MAERPSASARLRFAWILGLVIIAYGALAIALSVHVIDQQSGARADLHAALQNLIYRHREELMPGATAAQVQESVDEELQSFFAAAVSPQKARLLNSLAHGWVFASPQQAQKIAQALILRLNHKYPGNACGRNGPSFVKADALPTQHACMVAIEAKGNVVQVTGYDTQGIAMDNVYVLYSYR